MAISDRIYIKTNTLDEYSSSGTSKTLTTLHTKNGTLYPVNDFSSLKHTVLKTLDANINAYNRITSDSASTGFTNATHNVGGFPVNEKLSDIANPMMSGRIYKGGVDYPLMKPDMVYTLDRWSTNHMSNATSIASGNYTIGRYGSSDGKFAGTGIIAVQAGGGGGGGANPSGADCAGAGGGAGGSCILYYRIKSESIMRVSVGAGGTKGYSSKNAKSGGNSSVFFDCGGSGIEYGVICYGGGGGKSDEGGSSETVSGGSGGGVAAVARFRNTDGTYETTSTSNQVSGGGQASWSESSNLKNSPVQIINNDWITLIIIASCGGAGGGRGDDTSTSGSNGQAGAKRKAFTINVPYALGNTTKTFTYAEKSGGVAGGSVSGSNSGGGGASLFAAGGWGSSGSSAGGEGSLGSGAGGAGAGGNDPWDGAKGGAGVVYYYK